MCSRHAEEGAGYDITDATADHLQDTRRLCRRCGVERTSNYGAVCDGCYQTGSEDSRRFCPRCTLPWAEHSKDTGVLPFGCAA